MKTCTIYALSATDLPDEIRYIGCTVRKLKYRLSDHIYDSKKKDSTPKHKWINSVIEDGGSIQTKFLKTVPWEDRKYWETKYIKEYSKKYDLLNIMNGGPRPLHKPLTQKKPKRRFQ